MSKNYFKGSVVLNPVPVVMVTSRNSEGKDNVFTVAWTGTVCTKPPMLSISIRPERLSYEYIKESMEATILLALIIVFCVGYQMTAIRNMSHILAQLQGRQVHVEVAGDRRQHVTVHAFGGDLERNHV